MARKTTAKSAHTEAMTREVKERGHAIATGAWNSSAHTIHSVRNSEKRWSAAGESCKSGLDGRKRAFLFTIFYL